MGFLKRFFRNVLRDDAPDVGTSSFATATEEDLQRHLGVHRYGSFMLTDAVRPAFDLKVVPCEGFRHDVYEDDESKVAVPVLMGAATSPRVFEIFMELLEPLGPTVDVVLETSHDQSSRGHDDHYREQIDAPVLKSILWDYEDLLTNDGCTGIAVLNPAIPQEVQFDEHKLVIVYGDNLGDYEQIFREHRVPCNDEIRFITEAEHVHASSDHYHEQFDELRMRLGADTWSNVVDRY